MLLNIEICQKAESSLRDTEIESVVNDYLLRQGEIILDSVIYDSVLPDHLKSIRICPVNGEKCNGKSIKIPSDTVRIFYYVYQICLDSPSTDSLDEGGDEEVPASVNWMLPNQEFEGLWESLIFEDGLKEQLITYVKTTLLYSEHQVAPQVVRWNGVVLLHGPPGTGKTSLCKALAQKLSIRLGKKYRSGQLIEINTHSLFSKWFSESAKLVLKMFTAIRQWLETEGHFVCILIDEVESVTHARQSALGKSEPADSLRVVNAVLTQIDQLQRYPNVLILATSNVTEAIDVAFADRADLKLFIGFPSKWGIYEILRSCIQELVRCKLVVGGLNDIFSVEIYKKLHSSSMNSLDDALLNTANRSKDLMELSAISEGLSGRTLRKIPFLTSAKFIERSIPSVDEFVKTMKTVVLNHKSDHDKFFNEKNTHLSNGLD